MATPEENRSTAIACFREIAHLLPKGINVDSIIDAPESESSDVKEYILGLGEKLKILPEYREDAELVELLSHIGSPVLAKLKNGNWVCFLGVRRSSKKNEPGLVTVFDPLARGDKKVLLIPQKQFEDNWSNEAVFFRGFGSSGFSPTGTHTAIYSFSAIAKHHGVDAEVLRIIHEYALEEDEPTRKLMMRIVNDAGMKGKFSKTTWNKLFGLREAFPVMGFTREGKAVVFCGTRTHEEEEQLVVWDPTLDKSTGEKFIFVNKDKFEESYTNEILLVKKTYSLLDESQPFGIAWFIPEFLRQKKVFAEITLAVLAISAIALITPLFFQIVVDKVLAHRSYMTLNVLGIGIICVLLFNAFLEYLRGYLLLFATNKIDIRTATRTFKHLMDLPVGFFEKISSGVLIKHMQQTDKIRGFLSGNLFFTILELISLVVFIPFLLIYSVKLTLIVLGFAAMMALVIAFLIKPFRKRLQELYLAEGKRQGMLVETIHGINTVKSLALEPAHKRKWNDTAAYAITRYFRVGKISLTAKTFSQLLEKVMVVTIIWVGAMDVFDKEMTVGALIAFQMLSGRVTGPLVKLVSLIHEYQQTALSVKMLGQVMNSPAEKASSGIRQPLRGEISFENITFNYTPEAPPAVKNFSLHVPAGTTLGIVGRSGSGKTTLTKLLQGLYPLQSGIIKFENVDIREIDRAHLRSNIGVVLQDNFFFQGTIRENIALTKKDATMEEIVYAARMSGSDEFIQKLPKSFDSELEENASNLSGGQKQRLAIARALLTNPKIIIFDEATSALDPESEELIRKNLRMICRNRTVIIVSHRLSMITAADNIIVLDNGEMIMSGSHKELVGKPGVYREFWQQQMGKTLS